MSNLRLSLPLAALALALCQGEAAAQVVVRTPFVHVFVPGRPAVAPLPPPALRPVHTLPVEPGSPPVTAAPVQTLAEFASCFRPDPCGGRYEVVLQHPCTCCPVKVCFCLPKGCPRKIRACKNSVEIRYGLCKAVVLHFLPDGSVRVRD